MASASPPPWSGRRKRLSDAVRWARGETGWGWASVILPEVEAEWKRGFDESPAAAGQRTVTIQTERRHEDHDDVLTAVASEWLAAHPECPWSVASLDARWQDERTREAVVLTVPSRTPQGRALRC